MYFKGSRISLILLRKNHNCLDGVDYQVVTTFLIIIENTPHFFDQERRLFEGGVNW